MSNVVIRLNAALSGRYRIERQLGEGGMATVYLADDLKHGRKVALKVLKPELAAVVGAERFLAEIRTTANLQHPHILPLFDSGAADTFLFYVMPYVDGESLRERLDREHQLPVDAAVRIATDMAEALDYAHRHGVVHRDIKPANVLLVDGRPVIADFGIALAVSAGGAGRLTETGLSLGTPHYMSPEQATGGQTVGPATDIWALGCVLYEMLVGEPPYTGSTPQAILGRIIAGEPVPVREHRKSVPEHVVATIANALEKLPVDRFATADDFAKAVGDRGFRHGEEMGAHPSPGSRRLWNPLSITASGVAVVATGVAVFGALASPQPTAPIWSDLTLLPDLRWPTIAGNLLDVSPDGTRIVFVAGAGGADRRLWVRSLDQPTAVALPGTEGAVNPRFSPNGRSVAFQLLPGTFRVVSLDGGPARSVLPEEALARGVSFDWGSDDFLYYTNEVGGLSRVRASGGAPEEITQLADGENLHYAPSLFPNAEALFFVRIPADGTLREIAVVDLDSRLVSYVTEGTGASYAPTGHIVFGTDEGTLLAAPFDEEHLQLTGSPTVLVDGVATQPGANRTGGFALSNNGMLVFIPGEVLGGGRLVWVDRSGREEPIDVMEPLRRYWPQSIALSPDDRYVAVAFAESASDPDLWVKELDPLGPTSRLIASPDQDRRPLWVDDETIAYQHYVATNDSAEWRTVRVGGVGAYEVLLAHEHSVGEIQVTPDGRGIIFREGNSTDNPGNLQGDIGLWDRATGLVTENIIPSRFVERAIALSQDGRLLAYVSDQNGADEVYVVPFPVTPDARHVPVSRAGGREPVWSKSARELFYREPETGQMMVATYETSPAFSIVDRQPLFDASPYDASIGPWRAYDVTRDGQRFAMIRLQPETADAPRLALVQNFFTEIERRVGR